MVGFGGQLGWQNVECWIKWTKIKSVNLLYVLAYPSKQWSFEYSRHYPTEASQVIRFRVYLHAVKFQMIGKGEAFSLWKHSKYCVGLFHTLPNGLLPALTDRNELNQHPDWARVSYFIYVKQWDEIIHPFNLKPAEVRRWMGNYIP